MFNNDKFDKEFDKTLKVIIGATVVGGITGIGVIVFVCWIIIQLLQHFGVV